MKAIRLLIIPHLSLYRRRKYKLAEVNLILSAWAKIKFADSVVYRLSVTHGQLSSRSVLYSIFYLQELTAQQIGSLPCCSFSVFSAGVVLVTNLEYVAAVTFNISMTKLFCMQFYTLSNNQVLYNFNILVIVTCIQYITKQSSLIFLQKVKIGI